MRWLLIAIAACQIGGTRYAFTTPIPITETDTGIFIRGDYVIEALRRLDGYPALLALSLSQTQVIADTTALCSNYAATVDLQKESIAYFQKQLKVEADAHAAQVRRERLMWGAGGLAVGAVMVGVLAAVLSVKR